MNYLRPCRVRINGKIRNGLFHRWFSHYWTQEAILQGQVGGQYSNVLALVEIENGEVGCIHPSQIRFLDSDKYFNQFDWSE